MSTQIGINNNIIDLWVKHNYRILGNWHEVIFPFTGTDSVINMSKRHHDIEMFPTLQALYERNPPVTKGHPAQGASNGKLWDLFY